MQSCSCPIGESRRFHLAQLARLGLLLLSCFLFVLSLAIAGVRFNLIHPIVGRIAIIGTTVVLMFISFLRAPTLSNVKLSWRRLGTGDWISVGFFPVSSVIGWSSFWSDLPQWWALFYTITSTVVHCLLFWFSMLYIMRLARSFRTAFGRFMEGARPSDLAQRRAESWHMRKCVPEIVTNRYMKKLPASAERRRRARKYPRRQYLCRLADTVADSYEDSSSWMSAALASGGLFTWMVQSLQPGPSALILFIPFALIPVVYIIRMHALGYSV